MSLSDFPDFSDVILTGGTGRSGTTVVGKLLSRHSLVKLAKPTEVKFLTSGNGLLDLVANPRFTRSGKIIFGKNANFNRFSRDAKGKWWDREGKRGGRTGLNIGIDETSLEELLENLNGDLKTDRGLAAAKFMRGFVDYQLHDGEKKYWVDTTPPNLIRADEISKLLPKVKFVHMIRDGRDVASSVVRERWGPQDYDEALIWWGNRMKQILTATKDKGNQVHHIWLEDLAIHNRDDTYGKLLEFLHLNHETKIDQYFEKEVLAEAVKSGRWRREVSDADKYSLQYQKILSELYDMGLEPAKRQI